MTDREIINAIIDRLRTAPNDCAYVTNYPSGDRSEPREIWIEGHGWTRADGTWLSGWTAEPRHYAFRPGWFDRWRIRRAVRAWERTV